MSGSASDGGKTDYFGTFLSVLSSGATLAAALAPQKVDLPDSLIQMLASKGGTASIDELLSPPFKSLVPLMTAIQDLRGFGLAETDGATVRLTAAGEAVAAKLRQAAVVVPG